MENNIDRLVSIRPDLTPDFVFYDKQSNGYLRLGVSNNIITNKIFKKDLINFIISNSKSVEIEMDLSNDILYMLIIGDYSLKMAKDCKRGQGNIILCGRAIYDSLLRENNVMWWWYFCEKLKDHEAIIAYVGKKSVEDAGMFVTEIDNSDEIYVHTFNENDISNTKNYYTHLTFKNFDE